MELTFWAKHIDTFHFSLFHVFKFDILMFDSSELSFIIKLLNIGRYENYSLRTELVTFNLIQDHLVLFFKGITVHNNVFLEFRVFITVR